ncbi:lysophospholipid acyltransferase 5 isoform X2 [Entelurus aequoreus]|uniref:lysophospholipid acyltransferase 5 isoform X2 n=1 Tax=Entelurus aequoreus TaxID=161455 RepID=UPI002B1D715D|nr:lysophospholipid acyltransferase 5 isoform X2 [Entelurus aequoreus]
MAAPWMEKLSQTLGSPEPAVRLIFSILIGYPFALFYRHFLFYQPATIIHLFHALSGLALATFNFGPQIYHSAVCILVQFLMLRLMGRTVTAVLSSFSFQMEELTSQQKSAALSSTLSLLEVCGFSYFYGGFLVGPQFTLRSYQRLVAGELSDCPGKPPNSLVPALKRFSLGFLFLAIFAIFSPHYQESYYLTDEYDAQPFWYRCVFILIWAKIILYKYVCCWLIAEGVCILTGLGYNGVIEGEHQWDACANMKVWLFETTPHFGGTIASFNINTNAWAARHVFKRLKFLGNKLLSHVSTLFFLTIWHGLHSGYVLCFSLEFFIIILERQAQALVQDSPALTKLANSSLYPLIYVIQQFIHWLLMGYALVPFCIFTYDKWLKVYTSVYFCGHVFLLVVFLVMPYLRKALVPNRERSQDKQD